MKILYYLFIITIASLFYSCDSPTISHSNPLTYGAEKSYFLIDPYIPYNQLDNRINYGIINSENILEDSTFLRATFYDNNTFRYAGDLYINDVNIKKRSADDIFNIRQLIDGFIDFGYAYLSSIDHINYSNELTFYASGDIIPKFKFTTENLDTSLVVLNISELKNIDKNKNHTLITNDIGFDDSRIRIYNSSREYLFYAKFKNEISISSDLLENIPNGDYNIECIKGYYKIDTIFNDEPLITNIFSSYTFKTIIQD